MRILLGKAIHPSRLEDSWYSASSIVLVPYSLLLFVHLSGGERL